MPPKAKAKGVAVRGGWKAKTLAWRVKAGDEFAPVGKASGPKLPAVPKPGGFRVGPPGHGGWPVPGFLGGLAGPPAPVAKAGAGRGRGGAAGVAAPLALLPAAPVGLGALGQQLALAVGGFGGMAPLLGGGALMMAPGFGVRPGGGFGVGGPLLGPSTGPPDGPWIACSQVVGGAESLGIVVGSFLEVATETTPGQINGAAPFEVHGAYPILADGVFLEAVLRGSSDAGVGIQLSSVFPGPFSGRPHAALHVCRTARHQCGAVLAAGRQVYHVETVRIRDRGRVSKPWAQLPPPAAIAGGGRASSQGEGVARSPP